jgi:hypothetical protein
MHASRVLEFTEDSLKARLQNTDGLKQGITKLPAIFASENEGTDGQEAQIGTITSMVKTAKGYSLEFNPESRIPRISNDQLERLASDLDIHDWEFSRTHWSVKDVDLFKILWLAQTEAERHGNPKVFSLNQDERIDKNLVSVMMPFDAEYSDVYEIIQAVATESGMNCLRADDIWEHDHVIEDIVSLVNRSRIVVSDCTGRNPNVFYEIGIAHTLGRDVILITQNKEDIPFDLRHLRYLQYLNNNEGRAKLGAGLKKRILTLIG